MHKTKNSSLFITDVWIRHLRYYLDIAIAIPVMLNVLNLYLKVVVAQI